MSRLFRAFSLVAVSVLLVMCQKELSHVGSSDPVIVFPDPITATIQGNILDEAGSPASGVTIAVGSQTATTDAKGYFRILNASLDKNAALVTAEKSGYFKAYRTFSATSGVNQVVIKLIKRSLTGTIDASTGGSVTLTNSAKVTLPANGVVVNSTGTAYTGSIKVFAAYIDPTASDIDETVPGSFMANNKNGSRVILASYGMLAVDLESTSGEKLQIKSGAVANLTTPIPASVQSTAPATISLWSVDETTGLWKEEGTATKTGSNYIGDVKHFSYWNCDAGFPGVTINMTIKNSDGQPLVHAETRIKRTVTTGYTQSYGWTDTLGQVGGLVPSNETLILEVLDPCYNVVYTQNIGPFTQNTNLGVITVSNPTSPSILTFKGKLMNCSNSPVTNGFAIIQYNNMVRYAAVDATGNFIVDFIVCSTSSGTATVLGIDAGNNQQGTAAPVAVTLPITNAGNVSACGVSSTQFINYTLDGTNYSVSSAVQGDSLTAYTGSQGSTSLQTSISGNHASNFISFSFTHATATAGTYTVNSIYVGSNNNAVIQPFNAVVTNFPQAIGEFYEGSFSGNYTSSSTTHTISGSFKVRKSF